MGPPSHRAVSLEEGESPAFSSTHRGEDTAKGGSLQAQGRGCPGNGPCCHLDLELKAFGTVRGEMCVVYVSQSMAARSDKYNDFKLLPSIKEYPISSGEVPLTAAQICLYPNGVERLETYMST